MVNKGLPPRRKDCLSSRMRYAAFSEYMERTTQNRVFLGVCSTTLCNCYSMVECKAGNSQRHHFWKLSHHSMLSMQERYRRLLVKCMSDFRKRLEKGMKPWQCCDMKNNCCIGLLVTVAGASPDNHLRHQWGKLMKKCKLPCLGAFLGDRRKVTLRRL